MGINNAAFLSSLESCVIMDESKATWKEVWHKELPLVYKFIINKQSARSI